MKRENHPKSAVEVSQGPGELRETGDAAAGRVGVGPPVVDEDAGETRALGSQHVHRIDITDVGRLFRTDSCPRATRLEDLPRRFLFSDHPGIQDEAKIVPQVVTCQMPFDGSVGIRDHSQ